MEQRKSDTTHAENPVADNAQFEVNNDAGTAVQLAHDLEQQQYSPWTKNMFRLYGVLCIAYLCGCLNGFDGSLMGGVNAMDSYQNYYGV